MATKAATRPRKAATRPRKAAKSKEDVHVRMEQAGAPQQVTPGEGGRYVYGIVQAKDPVTFGKSGIGGSGEMVYTVNYQDIAAVVSNTSVYIFDPTRENALAHEHVIETVMKNHTIIPMSFGTVFRTDDDIREVLKSIYPSLKDVLSKQFFCPFNPSWRHRLKTRAQSSPYLRMSCRETLAATSPCAALTSSCVVAKCSDCSGPTAPVRPRRCRC